MVVLVVEDEAIIAYCSAAMLEDAGHAVLGPAHTSRRSAGAGAQQAARRRAGRHRPGSSRRRHRRRAQLRAHYGTAIVFTTGQLDAARDHSDIAVAALSKPYDPAELPGIVEYAASRRGWITLVTSDCRSLWLARHTTSPARRRTRRGDRRTTRCERAPQAPLRRRRSCFPTHR